MKVLHVAETIKGGVATVINELVDKQLKDEFFGNVRVLIPESQIEELTIKNQATILSYHRTGRNLASFINLAKKFVSTVIKFQPDVVHIHSTFSGFICRVVLIFIPFSRPKVIYCPHAFSFMMSSSPFKKYLFGFVERMLQHITKNIICVSKHEYNEAIKHGINESKLKIIYNGISMPESHLEAEVAISEVNNERFTILFVGRFDYQKGYDLLCGVINKIAATNYNIEFILVGGYVNESKNSVFPVSNAVHLKGWLPKKEVLDMYKNANLLVIPSRWEGFAMVPIEAFSMGVPVLASDFPSFGEIILDGETGFTFKNGCAESLYNKIIEIYLLPNRDDVLNEIAVNANNDFFKYFTSDVMAEKTKLVYLS